MESGLDWGLWAWRVSGGVAERWSGLSGGGVVAAVVTSCGGAGRTVGARCKPEKRKQDHVNAETGEEAAESQGEAVTRPGYP